MSDQDYENTIAKLDDEIAEQAATIKRLTEAAQAVVDAGIIPYFPMGDYYYSESDSELMDALAKALKEQTP